VADQPDTYYSCSDVVLTGGASVGAASAGGGGGVAAQGTSVPPSAAAAQVGRHGCRRGGAEPGRRRRRRRTAAAEPDIGPIKRVADSSLTLPFVFGPQRCWPWPRQPSFVLAGAAWPDPRARRGVANLARSWHVSVSGFAARFA
jgi:hypothetical protein